MFDNTRFQQLVDSGQPTGEVIATDRFLVKVKGLDGIAAEALVLFENGERGMVREVHSDAVTIMNLNGEETPLGSLVVLQDNIFTTPVGDGLIGRVVNALGEPMDGKGPIQFAANWPIYNQAPGMMDRAILNEQLPTGVTIADTMFPIVLGQRIAMLGDTKTGKTAFLTQLGINQTGSDRIVVYVLMGKRRVEVDQLINTLNSTGAIKNSIVVVANIFDSLAQSYLAPYIGCTMAEYLWYNGRDTIVIYDDLSSHAKVYREVALLAGGNPGRESYPGDMFFAHSSLLERAGKLASNGKTLTALPVVITPGDDITAFLPTSMMSITDGQLIFDSATFRQNIRPAINSGLSVSRVGGRAQSERQKQLSVSVFRHLATYRQASEFSHYGTEITPETQQALNLGKAINEVFRQSPSELFNLTEQQLMLQTVLAADGLQSLNIGLLKLKAKELGGGVQNDADFDLLSQQLLETVKVQGAAA
jgi:F-type H+/Na+-transporting ATPase subunit alpha